LLERVGVRVGDEGKERAGRTMGRKERKTPKKRVAPREKLKSGGRFRNVAADRQTATGRLTE